MDLGERIKTGVLDVLEALTVTRVGICNPDPNVMSTGESPTVAQKVTDGIANPVRRKLGNQRNLTAQAVESDSRATSVFFLLIFYPQKTP